MTQPLILVTGVTGYIAGRLIPELLRRDYRVRCLVREEARLRLRPWFEQVEVVAGDVLDAASLRPALAGVDVAYYLIHNMTSGPQYRQIEAIAARNFGSAAQAAGLRRIIYMGGLGVGSGGRHMASRRAVGEGLRASGIPVTEFRSCIVIGSGSASFEIIRHLTEWLPLIPAPWQTNALSQPIAIRDVLAYLLAALELPDPGNLVFEIGGASTLPYPDLMFVYARQRGLRRSRLPLPFFNVILSATIINRLTPVPLTIARPLMEELVAPSIVTDLTARQLFPAIHPLPYADAVKLALSRCEYFVDAPWISLLITRQPLIGPYVRTQGEGLLIDYWEVAGTSPTAGLLRLLNGSPPAGWITEANQPGQWVRLRCQRSYPGVLRVEMQLRVNHWCWAILFEPRGLMGFLWWLVLRPLYRRRIARLLTLTC